LKDTLETPILRTTSTFQEIDLAYFVSVGQAGRQDAFGFPALGTTKPYRPRDANDKPFVCQVQDCGKTFYYKHSLVNHVRQKHTLLEIRKSGMDIG